MGSASVGVSDVGTERGGGPRRPCDIDTFAATLAERMPPADLPAQIERLREDRRDNKRLLEASERALALQAERGWKAGAGSEAQCPAGRQASLVQSVATAESKPTASVSLGEPIQPEPGGKTTPPSVLMAAIPNDPITIDAFMSKFCEARSKSNRICRKRVLLAAARHKTVALPPQAGLRRHGQPSRYLTHDLLIAWQGFMNDGVDLPPLRSAYRSGSVTRVANEPSAAVSSAMPPA